MNFDQFSEILRSEIKDPNVSFSYKEILADPHRTIISNGIEIGIVESVVFINNLYRDTAEIVRFSQECEKFRTGLREKRPAWWYDRGKLTSF